MQGFISALVDLYKSVGFWILILSVAILYIFVQFIGSPEQINLLADASRARGLITFIVTVGAIGVAIIVMLAAFTVQSSGEDKMAGSI